MFYTYKDLANLRLKDKLSKLVVFFVTLGVILSSAVTFFPNKVSADYATSTPYSNGIFGISNAETGKIVYNCNGQWLTGMLSETVKVAPRLVFGGTPEDKAIASNKMVSELSAEEGAEQTEGCTGVFGTSASADPVIVSYVLLNYYYGNSEDSEQSGLLEGLVTASSLMIEQKPASGINYAEQQIYALSHFGDVSAAPSDLYYPGTGFSLLRPIQSFWGWSVNVCYGLLIFVIIGVAFAVMFRTRLNGAASVTIQSAIPNIAMAMILIPLSYAISGVFIDVVTVGTDMAHEFMLGSGSPARVVYEARNCSYNELKYLGGATVQDGAWNTDDETKNPKSFSECTGNLPSKEKDADGNYVKDRGYFADDSRMTWYNAGQQINVKTEVVNTISSARNSNTIVGTALNNSVTNLIFGIIDVMGGIAGKSSGNEAPMPFWIGEIVSALLAVLLFVTGIRIFALLLQKYLVFIIYPIFSPFIFATVAIPGNGTKAIMSYLRMLGSASAFYIVTYTMFLLATVLSNDAFVRSIPLASGNSYIPPLLGLEILGGDPSTVAGVQGEAFQIINTVLFAILAVAIFLNIPVTLKSIDDSWGTKLTMPQFLTNAIQSGKDSYNLAKKGVSTARGVGTKGLGAWNKTGGRGLNTLSRSLYGKNLTGEGGMLSTGYKKYASNYRARVSAARESNNPLTRTFARTVGNATLAGFRVGEKALGAGEGTKTYVDKDAKLKVEITRAAQPQGGGFINFTDDDAFAVMNSFQGTTHPGVNPKNPALKAYLTSKGFPDLTLFTAVDFPGFAVNITAEGFNLPSTLSPVGGVGDYLGKNLLMASAFQIDEAFDYDYERLRSFLGPLAGGAKGVIDFSTADRADFAPNAFSEKGGTTKPSPFFWFNDANTAYVRVLLDNETNIYSSSDRKKADIGLKLEFGLLTAPTSANPYSSDLFGEFVASTQRFLPTNTHKALIGRGAGPLKGGRLAMKISGVPSNVFTIALVHKA